jgi:hypothetical protein
MRPKPRKKKAPESDLSTLRTALGELIEAYDAWLTGATDGTPLAAVVERRRALVQGAQMKLFDREGA